MSAFFGHLLVIKSFSYKIKLLRIFPWFKLFFFPWEQIKAKVSESTVNLTHESHLSLLNV